MNAKAGGAGMGRALSREEAKELTRRRLLSAALRILDEKGEGGLSASAVSRAAGIAQSSFYVHFRDKDELLAVLGDEAVLRMRSALREARRRSREEPNDRERLRATFRLPLQRIAAHPALFRLGLRARHARSSPLGEATRELLAGYRRDLFDDLVMLGFAADTPVERRRVEMIADAYIALTEGLAIGHLEGRYPDVEEIVDVLALFTIGPRTLLRGD
ncbi:MAG TPA: TetR family transcriptional regulator [Candidatus Dormibacteraeota bacterium]|nr:TetR family transcriptional regulator [Candidatus Dormibacteraeota bacterium]